MTNEITTEIYEAMSEEVCRYIEVVDGAAVPMGARTLRHQRILRRLVNALEAASAQRYAVTGSVDLRLRDAPLLNRLPDVVVYDAALPGDAVLRSEHCALVVEIMSADSVITDRIDKPAEYAAAGIRHFWRVEDEQTLTVFRYRLDPATHTYATCGIDTGILSVRQPVSITIDLADLY